MNNRYKDYIKLLEDNAYLISMVPVEELLRFGYEIGLDENSRVIDLCCGYGTVLKIWSEAFGISGVGVDRESWFISVGKERLEKAGIDRVKLVCEDVTAFRDDEKYDVVICSETIGSIEDTLDLGEKFLKKGGLIAYHNVYSKIPDPPKELVDFDTEVLPLPVFVKIFKEKGYYLVAMASDTNGAWERYVISRCAKKDVYDLKENPADAETKEWIDDWYDMYFKYRRPFEGQAMFGLLKVYE